MRDKTPPYSKSKYDNRLIFAIVLIIFGIGLLVSNLNLLSPSLHSVVFSWQHLLVIIGLIFIAVKREISTGLSLVIIGLLFLMPLLIKFVFPNFVLCSLNMRHLFFPVVSICIGFYVLYNMKNDKFDYNSVSDYKANDFIDEFKVFGGGDSRIISNNFRGGRVSCIFGGVEIDCSQALLSDEYNEINLFLLMGGCTIIVPDTWTVSMQTSVFLAAISDKRHIKVNFITQDKKEIVIKGLICMGGCEIISERK